MRKFLISMVSVAVLTTTAYVVYTATRPQELYGSEDVYRLITLQLDENHFYDVHVPVEATLLETDGATIYKYDLLTVGVQDVEPTSVCKVLVEGRWVSVVSEEGWLKTSLAGIDSEYSYEGYLDTTDTVWEEEAPTYTGKVNAAALTEVRGGGSYLFGGSEFLTAQVMYGTFESCIQTALTRMSTLYKQPLTSGALNTKYMWMTSNLYVVAVVPINYNTCLVISGYGADSIAHAHALLQEEIA